MKIAAPLLLALLALLVGLVSIQFGAPAPIASPTVEPERSTIPVDLEPPGSVAVVELFTSEGCSSCPPADRLLIDLAERDDPRVLTLAFHVDYWNRLGWADPFSDAAYSRRQRAYARAFENGRVYTPQMVVNGQREFVGSRRREAEEAIQQALAEPASADVTVSPRVTDRTVHVETGVEGAPAGAVLHLALVQRSAEQAVPRGENAGRTLRHANVVRGFVTSRAAAGTHALALPEGLRPENAAVIAYAQDPETMRIFGAAQATLGE